MNGSVVVALVVSGKVGFGVDGVVGGRVVIGVVVGG